MFIHSCMVQFNIFLLSHAVSSLLDFVSLKGIYSIHFHNDISKTRFPYEVVFFFAYRILCNLTPSRYKSHLVAYVKGPI